MLSALLDHLWQSSLLTLAAGLIALTLHKAPASARYGLWFAASVKFLVPFAVLAGLGRVAAPRLSALLGPASVHTTPAAAFPDAALIEKAALPIAKFPLEPTAILPRGPLPPVGPGPAAQAAHHGAFHLDPMLILLIVWALGFGAVLVRWMVSWARVQGIVCSARPLDWPAPMPVLASPTLLEPGLIGILRPMLVVPENLPERLTGPQIDAILAHEVCHLRRRDNLTATVHTLVEAMFWFHPLVWWIGTRLIAERERACDETVVHAGHDRKAYARGLIESARLYVQSPLSCVAGASGSDLKTRVEAIMTAPPALPLSFPKKALLLAGGACVFATPVAAALVTAPEGRQGATAAPAVLSAVFAPARSHAISGAPAPPASTAAPEPVAAPPVTLAARERVLPPALSVARLEPPAAPPSRGIAVPSGLTDPPATPPQPAQQVTTEFQTPSAVEAVEPADAKQQALKFVRAFAAATPQRQLIARWVSPLCIRVVGLPLDQAVAVRARIEAVARAAGAPTGSSECRRENVEIGFSTEPQRMLDDVVAHRGALLGDRTSGTGAAKTITRPIQAWYLTNGVEFADAGTVGLKALARYQVDPNAASAWFGSNGSAIGGGLYAPPPRNPTSPPQPPSPRPEERQFLNVFVIVDLRRAGDLKLGLLSDYVAMVVLAQPQSLDRCNVLPSVTDLFADACQGRAGPSSLTPADRAYLTAVYTAPPSLTKIASRMAEVLSDPKRDPSYWMSRDHKITGSRIAGSGPDFSY